MPPNAKVNLREAADAKLPGDVDEQRDLDVVLRLEVDGVEDLPASRRLAR